MILARRADGISASNSIVVLLARSKTTCLDAAERVAEEVLMPFIESLPELVEATLHTELSSISVSFPNKDCELVI
jgi:hypothetical protein